jgi:hypothetical protein
MGIPLWVIRAHFIGVTHRHALHIRLPQKVKHHAQTLRADANESNIDLVAGRNVPRAAQHPPRHDREANRSCGSLPDELAP